MDVFKANPHFFGVTRNVHVTFRALFPVVAPPISLSEVMPKQFVPGTSVCALCKTVFGDKAAKNVPKTCM